MTRLDRKTETLAEKGDLDGLRVALADNPTLATATNDGDETLLHIMVRQWPKHENGADIAVFLLACGADVNAREDLGMTPLQGATGDIELTQVLLDAGAITDTYSVPHLNMSPAEVCLFYGLPAEAKLLVDYGASVDLRVAAGIGDEEKVRSFLGADGNFRTDAIGLPGQPGPKLTLKQGVTQALSYATRNGQINVVELLLDHGADIDALVPYFDVGCTPAHQAVSGDQPDILRMLIARGARLDILDDTHNSTPRGWAEHAGRDHLTKILVEAGG